MNVFLVFLLPLFTLSHIGVSAQQKGATPINQKPETKNQRLTQSSSTSPTTRMKASPTCALPIKMRWHLPVFLQSPATGALDWIQKGTKT